MRYLFLFSIILIFSTCEKKDWDDITDQVIFPVLFRNPCFDIASLSRNNELIFRDKESFESYVDSMRIYPYNLNCDTATVPDINFDKYTLVGKFTSGGGCDVEYKRNVFEDVNNKNIIYEIKINYTGLCEMLITSMNWALIPRIPDNYSVEFKVRER